MHKVYGYKSHILNRYFLIFKNHILYACFIHISHSYVHLFCIYMRKIRLGLCTRNVQKKHKNMHIYGGHFFSSEPIGWDKAAADLQEYVTKSIN